MTSFLTPLQVFIFAILFDITVQLTFEPDKLNYWHARGLILKFPNDFLICGIKKWTFLWIIAIVKLMFISLKILVSISSLYFITKGLSVCKPKLSCTPIFLLDVIV